MVDKNEAIIDRLKELKAKSGMTAQQIAEKSKLPESTVTRIFSGKTTNPTITTVIAITKAMGGTTADIFDDTVRVDVVRENVIVQQPTVKAYEDMIELYKSIVKQKDKYIKMLFICTAVVVAFVLFILTFDVLNGHIGYVKY